MINLMKFEWVVAVGGGSYCKTRPLQSVVCYAGPHLRDHTFLLMFFLYWTGRSRLKFLPMYSLAYAGMEIPCRLDAPPLSNVVVVWLVL